MRSIFTLNYKPRDYVVTGIAHRDHRWTDKEPRSYRGEMFVSL
jgi:hypothetical protein